MAGGKRMSVMLMDDDEILNAINDESIPDSDLVSAVCWKVICQVRGRKYALVDQEAWQSLCARRGYVLHRRNPRGF